MNKLVLAAVAALSVTGLAACGSGDTNSKSGRDAFLKGCTGAAHPGFSDAQLKNFCNCAVDELRKKGINTGDELKKAQADKSVAYEAAIRDCSTKYLAHG
jgi:hypothetical protein